METRTIELEERSCKYCGVTFRVMKQSPQQICSNSCEWWGVGAPKTYLKRSQGADSITVDVTGPKKPADKRGHNIAIMSSFPIHSKQKQGRKITMRPTETSVIKEDENGVQKIVNASELTAENGTPETKKPMPEKKETKGTKETLPELSDDSRKNLERVALDSMTLLKKSANKSMELMDECVSETDLQRGRDGGQKVESHRIELAISCANSIANTIQTQVNMVNAFTKLLGDK